jgi:hypothetical protein
MELQRPNGSRRLPATGHEIRNILGPIDDQLMLAIQNTGATPNDVLQALEWLEDDNYMFQLRKKLNEKVLHVCEIILSDMEDYDEQIHYHA